MEIYSNSNFKKCGLGFNPLVYVKLEADSVHQVVFQDRYKASLRYRASLRMKILSHLRYFLDRLLIQAKD